jgi:plasmid stabilization system protein ParE
MTVTYHTSVQKDVNGILKHYEGISPDLADEFLEELQRFVALIAENPDRSHLASHGLRRINLRRFPYHILFRRRPMAIRIIVVRHHKRHPDVGIRRL